MKAIILAAGKGGRLAPYTDSRPKCLVQVDGKAILDYQLEALEAAGVEDVVIVTGYRKEMVAEHLKNRGCPEFTLIENERYGETNTAYSLWLARHEMTDDFFYLNGDVLIHPEIIRRLAGSTAPEVLAMERKTCGEEEVKATLDGVRVTALSKTVPPSEAYGEFIGIAKFSRRFAPSFRAALEEVIEEDKLFTVYFEAALERLLEHHTLTAVDITDLPAIEIDFPEDLTRAENEVLSLFPKKNPLPYRVLFYIERDLHVPFLEPVFDHLSACKGYETAWLTVPYVEPAEGRPGMGLEPIERERLEKKGRFINEIAAFAPHVTVCADACTHLMDCGKLIFVGHGMISKGGFYTDSPLVRRENRADVICVPGTAHRDILKQNIFSPIVVTGFLKSDTFFSPRAEEISYQFRLRYNIPNGKRVVLFAPTFNGELSAIPCVGDRIGEVADNDTILLIKLHTMTDPAWIQRYRKLASDNPSVRFIDDIDAAPGLLVADILISDVSSVALEFMLLDKPVIVFNNPRIREYPHYNPDDIEYKVRDACIQVETMEDLKSALNRSRISPAEFSAKRRKYADMYSYGRDGHCSIRVARTVTQALEGGFENLRRDPSVSVVITWDHAPDIAEVLSLLDEIRQTASFHDMEIQCIGPRPQRLPESASIENWLETFRPEGGHLNKIAMMSRGEYLVILSAPLAFPPQWPRWLVNHFRFNPSAGAVMAFSDRHNYRMVSERLFPGVIFPDNSVLAQTLLATVMGMSLEANELASPCLIIPRKKVFECGGFPSVPSADAVRQFGLKLRGQGCCILQALDVFCQSTGKTRIETSET